MKGIILAGGQGTRLRPATLIYNKHLALVYDKPMILYPIQTLKDMRITDIMLITGGEHMGVFADFLGDGSEYGIKLTYRVQKEAGGIAQALSLVEDYVDEQFVVILGDNYFEYGLMPSQSICGLVVKEVLDPQRFGVYHDNKIIEKPKNPLSHKAVAGLYFYTPEIFSFLKTLAPSARGEMEITDLNNWCLLNLPTQVIEYDGFWSDMGTPDSLLKTATFVAAKPTFVRMKK